MRSATLIAAVGRSGQLGLGPTLPWHDPEDLSWFRANTMNGIVIMGRRTFEPIRHLQGTANRIFVPWSGDEDPEALMTRLVARHPDLRIWIAGGAHTYRSFMPFVARSVITHIDFDGPADVFMPPLWEGHP